MNFSRFNILKNVALFCPVVLGLAAAGTACAGTIAGPTFYYTSSWQVTGLGFEANVNSTLTSFTFSNQGLADTVDLVNSSGTILDSVAIPGSTPSATASVNWQLTAGTQYYLLQTTLANGMWMYNSSPAPSDSEITITDTGDFSYGSLNSSNFSVGGAAGTDTFYYDDFSNIVTSPSIGINVANIPTATPEPASALLILPAAVAALWRVRARKATNIG
jgi:hypothetical protein